MVIDYKKHPFYIFGTGLIAGVIGTVAVVSFILLPNYIQKIEVRKFLLDSGYTVLSSTEYNQLKQKKPKQLPSAGTTEPNLREKVSSKPVLSQEIIKPHGFITAISLKELRLKLDTRKLEPLEEGLNLSKLRGVFGYTVPWLLNSDPTGVVGGTGSSRLSLRNSRGGTAVMEVHKSKDGAVYVIAFISEQVRIKLVELTRKASFQTTVFFFPYNENNKAIAIPVNRIKKWEERSPREIGYIADVDLL